MQPQALKISNVTFSDYSGTSKDQNAIVLDCANIGCTNIVLKDIKITSNDPTKPAAAFCNHTYGTAENVSPPVTCLSK